MSLTCRLDVFCRLMPPYLDRRQSFMETSGGKKRSWETTESQNAETESVQHRGKEK